MSDKKQPQKTSQQIKETAKKSAKENALGLKRSDYKGSPSTLCTGCGHDSITNQIIGALFQSNITPYEVVKLSGIGCSSKTPAYFLNQSHGFNSIHGRMASLASGVHLAQSHLKIVGISGDGDTASIGLGGFAHMIRRNVPMVYIVENNGVYGLTKGQFSATADLDHKTKKGQSNLYTSIDICRMAIDLGCGFVARGFSGDMKQMTSLLSAAFKHQGCAVIDVISPCVTFANHSGSTKSYDYVKEHLSAYHEIEFLPHPEVESVDYKPGQSQEVTWPDGSKLVLKKAAQNLANLNDPDEAMKALRKAENNQQILTGLFMLNETKKTLNETKNIASDLVHHDDKALKIPSQDFTSFVAGFS